MSSFLLVVALLVGQVPAPAPAARVAAPAAPVAAPAAYSPSDLWDAAYLDLFEGTPAEDQKYTRYLDLHNIPAQLTAKQRSDAESAGDVAYDRQDFVKAFTYAANSTSYRAEFTAPQLHAKLPVLKFDLRSFTWDYISRSQRLAELEKRGANFNLKDEADKRLFLDPWEKLTLLDPYFAVDKYYYDNTYAGPQAEGWIDPKSEKAARLLSYSRKFMLRGDWVLPRLLQEKGFGGIYSTLLMIPKVEAEYYKSLLIDVAAFERDNYLLKGGAVLGGGPGGVALHNRELQLMPSPYGAGGGGYYWRTFDVKVDARFLLDADGNQVLVDGKPVPKSVLEAFRGTIVHDGREAIGTLPNGLHWYRLDGPPVKGQTTGLQADVVPEDIAQVKEPLVPVKETRVINAYKCLECHLPNNGVYPFDDVIRKTFLTGKKFNFEQAGYEKGLEAALNDYYSSTLGETIERQRSDYARRLKQCVGLDGTSAAKLVVGMIEHYTSDLISPAEAAVEMGLTPEAARVAWLGSKNPQLFALAADQPIRRAAWEQSFADGMRAISYSWESQKPAPKPAAVKPPAAQPASQPAARAAAKPAARPPAPQPVVQPTVIHSTVETPVFQTPGFPQ